MAIERLRGWVIWKFLFRQMQRAMKKSAGPGRVNNESSADGNRLAVLRSYQDDPIRTFRHMIQLDFVNVFDAETLSLLNQIRIEVSAKPMRIGDSVMRTCRYKKLVLSPRIRCILL